MCFWKILFLSVTFCLISCQATGQVKCLIFYEKIYIVLTCYSDQPENLKSSEGPTLKDLQARGRITMYQNTNTTHDGSNKCWLKEISIHSYTKKPQNIDIES